ncbi:uncharacterized protein LOC134242775 [Saccostrea cucullata]|uniref:uncharacterized protein LOC134242775 n=1 Tax=Saccostrea cuccullata TaxID=36930 RepID=UPI002ED381A1
MESNVKIFREERNEILREPILDFGEGPVTNLEEKLEILKFPYKWADIVEEEERGSKEPPIFNKTSLQDDLEHQKVTEKEGNAKQEIPPDNVSETKDLPQLLKAETEAEKKTKELEVSKMETQQIKPELLSNDEDENENFVPRKLFLFGVVEFKSNWKQINKNAEQPNTPKKSTNVFNSATEPVPKVTTVKKRTSISRKIKTFLGFR